MTTAPTLRDLRRAVGLTQRELAARSSVSVRTIQLLETGAVTRPRRATLELLTAALTDRAGPPVRAVRSYAGRVSATAPAGPVPAPYAFPTAALGARPTRDARPLYWLEATAPAIVLGPDGPRSEPRFNVCRALPLAVTSGDDAAAAAAEPRWAISVLARDVAPLDATELVDALRAFRADPREAL